MESGYLDFFNAVWYPSRRDNDTIGGADALAKCAEALYESACKLGTIKRPPKNTHCLDNKLLE